MKQIFRKITVVLLAVTMVLAIVGCDKSEEIKSVRIGALKGPTSIGLVELMERAERNETDNEYTFTMETAADTLLAP